MNPVQKQHWLTKLNVPEGLEQAIEKNLCFALFVAREVLGAPGDKLGY